MQVHQFRAFLMVAQELNFRRAADRLSVSQPGLSEQIRNLERHLGVSLFVRDRSGTRLTAAGARLLPLADAAVAAVDDLLEAAAASQPHAAHRWPRRFRIGLLGDGLGELTWQLLRAFAAVRPDVEMILKPLSFLSAFQAIELGLADAVLCTGPATPTDRQEVTTVGAEPIAALMTRGNHLAEEPTADLQLIVRKITFDTPTGMDPAFRRFWIQQDLRDQAHRAVSTLHEPPDGPLLHALATRFGRSGGVGLWPARIPLDEVETGCITRPLDRPLEAPVQILSDRRSDHARQLLQLAAALS